MKKIAIITPFLAQGGLEKVAVTGAEYLKNHFDVTFIVFDTFQVDYEYNGKMIDLQEPMYGMSPLNKIKALMNVRKKLIEVQKKEHFDLIIVHGEMASMSVLGNDLPNRILVIHENRFAKKISKVKNFLFNILAIQIFSSKKIKKIVTVSEGIRQSFIENFNFPKNEIVSINNPYEIDDIIKLSEEKLDEKYTKLFDKNKILLIAARLSEQKGHKYFLKVFKELNQKDKSYRLILLGDGELRFDLINLCKELNLKIYSSFDDDIFNITYDVYFLGFDKNPYKYMKNSKLFIMSSLWEGFGNTLVESMACNTPVLSTDCKSGPKEIISPDINEDIKVSTNGKYGFLMPTFDKSLNSKEWIKTIENICDDKDLYKRYQESGQKRAWDFDKSIIMKKWKNLIESELN